MRQPNWGRRLNEARLIERHQQEDGPTSKLGLAIYRCTYEDGDDAWERFVVILRERVRHGLDVDQALDLEERFDWVLMENKAQLDHASVDDVRSQFQRWAAQQVLLDNVPESCCAARYNFCIYVDKAVLDSVLENPRPRGFKNLANAFLIIIDARRYIRSGWEPSTTHVALFALVPRVYSLLNDVPGYDMIYREPPEVYLT